MARTKYSPEVASESQVSILFKSTRLSVKDIEKITSLLLATLSESLPDKTLSTTEKEYRITENTDGRITSLSVKINL